MHLYTVLWVVVATVFCLTLVLDVTQQKVEHKDRSTIAFASMWAPGEPMMKGYEKLFVALSRSIRSTRSSRAGTNCKLPGGPQP